MCGVAWVKVEAGYLLLHVKARWKVKMYPWFIFVCPRPPTDLSAPSLLLSPLPPLRSFSLRSIASSFTPSC